MRRPPPLRTLVPGLLAALALAACGGDEGPAARGAAARPRPTARPSVVLIDVSGARDDAVHPAQGEPLLPAFAAFAAKATAFRAAASPATWEVPSVAGLLTGLIPNACGVRGVPDLDAPYLIPAVTTLAEMLGEEGYATAAFVAPGLLPRAAQLDQGFESWDEGWRPGDPEDAEGGAARAVSAWLAAREKDRPFFLFLAADLRLRAHVPGPTPERPNGPAETARAAYAERAGRVDGGLSRVLAALDAAPLPPDAITILLSDHGAPIDPPLLGQRRGGSIADAVARVPLAIRWKGMRPGAVRGSCGLVDVLPTIRDAMGLPPMTGLSGRPLRPLAEDPEAAGAPAITQGWRREGGPSGMRDFQVWAVRTPRAKFVALFTDRPPSWTEQVYDLAADPGEASPLADPDLERFGPEFAASAKRLREYLDGRRKHLEDPIVGPYLAGSR